MQNGRRGINYDPIAAVCCWYGGVALTNLKAPSVKATFDKATTTCVSPFSNLEQTDGQKVLAQTVQLPVFPILNISNFAQDGKRGQCFKGHSGSVLIELIEPLHLEEVFISFNKQAGKTRPKHVVFFVSFFRQCDRTYSMNITFYRDPSMKMAMAQLWASGLVRMRLWSTSRFRFVW